MPERNEQTAQAPTASVRSLPIRKPELLAPAGDWDCVRAAIENGADAVYLGLDEGFNARARATNFRLDDADELMDFLHRRCVKGYVTLNTLAFTDELQRMEDVGRKLAAAGVDAALVQDLGVARLLRQVCPELALHASTQMTLTSAECIAVAADLGIERVVLPRELSISEIRDISSKTEMPLEAFIHGALCVAYSGQCLTSESLGGRSANRGQCAQACRLAYDLICDGKDVDLGDQKYLLSPQDLAAFALASDLIGAGICSFKIEGRLKTPEYVANTVQHYRTAIDAAVAGRNANFTKQQIDDVEMSFSRGFSPGWLEGCDHKMLVPATSSAKRGVFLGEVTSVSFDSVTVHLKSFLAAGDGVVFEGDREHNAEQGGRVYEIFRDGERQTDRVDGGQVELTFNRQTVDVSQLAAGLNVWKTDDPRLNKRLRATFEGSDARRRVPVNIEVRAVAGEALFLRANAFNGASCEVLSEGTLEVARKHAITSDVLRQQLGRLGATIFELRELDATIEGNPMVPLSVLGTVRRKMIEALNAAKIRPRQNEQSAIHEPPAVELPTPSQGARAPGSHRADLIARDLTSWVHRDSTPGRDENLAHSASGADAEVRQSNAASSWGSGSKDDLPEENHSPSLNVLCRTLEQLRTVVDELTSSNGSEPQRTAYADFADIRQYRDAVAIGREASVRVYPATPRIQKPGEMGLFKAMAKHEPDGVLIRNLSGMAYFRDLNIPTVADFSLNVTNELTAGYLMNHGAERVTASYDMNRDQLADLVQAIPSEWLEVVIHQHMPMFHMEHCVFCSVLSPGTNKTNCGRPCDFHKVELRDRIGMEHPLTADVGCRNTLFNATPQSAAEVVPTLLKRGVRQFRIEFLNDDETRIQQTLRLYRSLLDSTITGADVWQQLQASNRVGVTRGTLEERRNPLAIL